MEDIFDNLLYIVIVLASFIISALGKKKKKQQRPMLSKPNTAPVSSEPKKQNNFNLEALIKEQMGIQDEYEEDFFEEEPEQEPIVQQPAQRIEYQPIDRVPEYMLDDKEDTPYSIEYDENKSTINQEKESIEQLTEQDSIQTILQDFDLQDAVIYSEILNRKEY